jgi:hypothetical protein
MATAVARPLPLSRSMRRRLRQRGPDDEIQDGRLPEPSDLISGEDVFPDDGVAVDGEGDDHDEDRERQNPALGLLAAVPGPLIATATFVPTFLAIFFGLSYVVGTLRPGATASTPMPSATALMSDATPGTPPPISESLPLGAPRTLDSPSGRPADPRDVTRPTDPPFRGPSAADLPRPAIESPAPTLPAAQPRTALTPTPESRAGRAAAAPQQPQAAVLDTSPERTPAAESRKSGRDWTPAAAFADRAAADRLASSIQQQGYPVEIRQESSSSRPWVVWIGAQPRAGERRR